MRSVFEQCTRAKDEAMCDADEDDLESVSRDVSTRVKDVEEKYAKLKALTSSPSPNGGREVRRCSVYLGALVAASSARCDYDSHKEVFG